MNQKCRSCLSLCFVLFTFLFTATSYSQQTLAFPGAEGFGRFAKGARGAASPQVYIVTSLNDAGAGSFRDAVSQPGRIIVFAVGGIVRLNSDIVVAPNTTIAAQTAPGDGIVFFGKRITFSNSSNTIARYLRVRLGATGNSGKDASGLSNGANMIFDHCSFTWGMDEVFSINWDGKNTSPDNITLQNCIIGQGLHRENHSAGGLIQTPDGGKISLLKNLYISNKTRNPKVKGVNEFVNNVVYDWGNGNRLDNNLNYGWEGDAYIMGGSSGVSEVNIINNYFMGGPLTPPSKTTPFSRGTGTFNVYGAGNFFDNNQNGVLDGTEVPFDSVGYPGISGSAFQASPYAYPAAAPTLTAAQAYQHIIDNVGANYPRRDEVDTLLVGEVQSRGTRGVYMYRETANNLSNGGLGEVFGAPAPLDSDADGMPDAWEMANGLNKDLKADATQFSTIYPDYLNIEVYINSLTTTPPATFIKPPTNLVLTANSVELPSPSSSVNIGWKDNADNENVFILERSTNGTTYNVIHQPAANAVSYIDDNLVPNTTYYYRIKAANATDTSVYALGSVLTPPLPSAPIAATTPTPANKHRYAELNAAGNLTLKWAGSSNTTTYSVYFGTDSTNLPKLVDLAYAASPSYTVPSLSANTTYYWRIDATNNKGTATGTLWSFRSQPVMAKGLMSHWSFDETQGRDCIDSAAFQNHGVLGLNDDVASIRVQGKIKGAVNFASASQNMYVFSAPHEDQLWLNRGSFTLSFWMKAPASMLPPDNNSSAYIMCKGSITRNSTTGATGKRIDIEAKNKQIRFAIDDDVTKYELQVSGTGFYNDNWVHVAAVRDSAANRLRLYLNGVKFSNEVTTTQGQGIGEESAMIIGNIGELEFLAATNAPAPYKGMLDEFKVFNYALTQAEITALANPPATLPVSLQQFAAATERNRVRLTWTTATEENNAYFELQRSTNGYNYTTMGTVQGHGTTAGKNDYLFYDNQPQGGTNYYRLLQYDINGKMTNQGIRTALFKTKNMQLLVSPNLVNDKAQLQFMLSKAGAYRIELIDARGAMVKEIGRGVADAERVITQTFYAGGQTPGVYIVRLITSDDVITQRMIIRR